MAFTAWLAGDKITAARLNTMVSTVTSYTPIVTNGGSATFTVKTGIYVPVGPLTWINIDITIGTAGSGSGLVTISMPTTPDRTQRQALTMHTESIGANGNAISHIGGGEAVFLAGGSGATTDRLRTDEGSTTARENNILGADLLTGGHITIQGFYL
ncbi:hypothetical protein [Actinacidiphila sp. ITFR-21]|uniref:hypothetical protein n=1 Tax=Actinacidiphila sp. ITFR-21 TaxID=3075199 RepID=UPI00288A5D20|nr:hypothetical protein [Streptomyces sp. ITFR-21]WNI19179.1 hypothetical protein RLT57_28990 [Streptomyces sp. ITFR-21]